MAHHNFERSDLMKQLFDDPGQADRERALAGMKADLEGLRLGATGQYPEGRYGAHDEGEIRFAVAADVPNQKILIDFGKPVHSLGMNAGQAQGLIDALQEKVWSLRGIR